MGSGSTAPATQKTSTRSQSQRGRKPETTTTVQTRKTSPAKTAPVSPAKKMAKSPVKEPNIVHEEPKKPAKKEKSETKSPIKSKRIAKQSVKSPKKVVEKSDTEDEESSDEEITFMCSYCDKSFKRKYDLEKHSMKHTVDKPYKCGICGKQVKSSSKT
jgi:hypothetical protein